MKKSVLCDNAHQEQSMRSTLYAYLLSQMFEMLDYPRCEESQ